MKKLTAQQLKELSFIYLSAYNKHQHFTAENWLRTVHMAKTDDQLKTYIKMMKKY